MWTSEKVSLRDIAGHDPHEVKLFARFHALDYRSHSPFMADLYVS
jgi:hypothetical protein